MELAQGEPPHFDAQPMRVMLLIAKNPPPTLNNPHKHSPELNDFLAKCLVKDPLQRPGAKQLLQVQMIVNTLMTICSTSL